MTDEQIIELWNECRVNGDFTVSSAALAFARKLLAASTASDKQEAVNGIPATLTHDEGAIARCSYCGRYSLDPKTLSNRQPKCDCGEQHGWSGSFKKPGPDSKWSGAAPLANPSDKQEAKPVAVMWFEPGSGKPRFAGVCDTVQAGTWERGTKLYAAPPAQSAEQDRIDAERYRKFRLNAYYWGIGNPTPQQLDARIDAAIAKGASK